MAVLQATTITGGLIMHGMATGFMKISADGSVMMDTNTYLTSGATATSATVAYKLEASDSVQNYGAKFQTNDYSTMTFYSRAWSTVQGANGLAYNFTTHTNSGSGGFGALQIYYGEGGHVFAPTSFRAPIFYDSNDTAYYGDFNSQSRFNTLKIGNQSTFNSGTTHALQLSHNNRYLLALNYNNSSYYPWLVNDSWNGYEALIFHYNGIGDKFYFNRAGQMQADGDMRAPIFYDSQDTGYYLDPNGTSNLSRLIVNNGVSGAALLVGSSNTSRIINDNARKALVINADYYPALHINAYGGNNSTHGAYIVMSGNLSSGGYRLWTMGIANLNPGIFSIGYSDLNDGNGHYGVGDNWSGNDAHHGRLIIDTSGNTKIRGMLYVNGTSGGITTGNAVIHSGTIGSQSVAYASNADTVDGYHMNQNVLTTSSPTFANVTLDGSVNAYGLGFRNGTAITYLGFGGGQLSNIFHTESAYGNLRHNDISNYEVSADGSSWSSGTLTSDIYNLFLGERDKGGNLTIAASGVGRYQRFTFAIGYKNFDMLHITGSTNGEAIYIKLETSTDGGSSYTENFTSVWNSWPGNHSKVWSIFNSAITRIRLTIYKPGNNYGNPANINSINYYGGYSGYGERYHMQVYSYDYQSANITRNTFILRVVIIEYTLLATEL